MPIYTFRCQKCNKYEDVLLLVDQRNDKRFHCNTEMMRILSIPQPPIMKQSTKEKVAGGINNNDWMKPSYKKLAMGGFDREKHIF